MPPGELRDNVWSQKLIVFWLSSNRSPDSFWISFQVQTFWQWFDYLCQQAHHDGKEICLVNIDETSIHRCALRSKGYVTKKKQVGPTSCSLYQSQFETWHCDACGCNQSAASSSSIAAAIRVVKQADIQSEWHSRQFATRFEIHQRCFRMEHRWKDGADTGAHCKITHFIYKRSSNNSFARCCSITTTVTSYAYFYWGFHVGFT